MADEQPKSPWKKPQFEKLNKLSELMEKVLSNQIALTKTQIQDVHNLLEVKRKMENRFGKKKT